jgi:sugar/nucleoside kinase (ribokinase family)
MNLDVVCFGSAGFDIYINGKDLRPNKVSTDNSIRLENDSVYPVEHAIYEAGGAGFNAATVFARQGINPGLIARTGKDHLANQIKIIAKHEGINSDMLIAKAEHHTDMNIKIVTDRTHEIDLAYKNSSKSLKAKDIKYPGLKAKLVYLAELPEDFKIYKFLANWAEVNNVPLYVNIADIKNYRKKQLSFVIKSSNKLMLSVNAATQLLGETEDNKQVISELIKMGAKSILLYDVNKETYAYEDETLYRTGMYKKTNPLDMTGADDVFAAGYAAAIFANKDVAQSLTMASAMACSVLNIFGTRTAILKKPTLRTMKVESEVL